MLTGVEPIDRTAINAWEDGDFVAAVKATGRRKLVMAALWTEVCLAFPALDALRAGYEVYPIVDAVGGTSRAAHLAGLHRIVQAGAQPISVDVPCVRAAARLGAQGHGGGVRADPVRSRRRLVLPPGTWRALVRLPASFTPAAGRSTNTAQTGYRVPPWVPRLVAMHGPENPIWAPAPSWRGGPINRTTSPSEPPAPSSRPPTA